MYNETYLNGYFPGLVCKTMWEARASDEGNTLWQMLHICLFTLAGGRPRFDAVSSWVKSIVGNCGAGWLRILSCGTANDDWEFWKTK